MILTAEVSIAQTDTVYSVNIVGFQRIDVPSNGLALASTPLTSAPTDTVQEVVGPQMTGGSSLATADRLFLWSSSSNEYTRLFQLSSGSPSVDGKWIDTSVVPNIIATNGVETGTGFWLQNIQSSNQSIVVVGDVVTDAVVTNVIQPGLHLLAYPYTSDIALNSSGLTNGHPGTSIATADRVTLWDTVAQDFKRFFLLSSGSASVHRKWIDTSVVPNILATNDLRMGEGFWYERVETSSFEWVESRPYALP